MLVLSPAGLERYFSEVAEMFRIGLSRGRWSKRSPLSMGRTFSTDAIIGDSDLSGRHTAPSTQRCMSFLRVVMHPFLAWLVSIVPSKPLRFIGLSGSGSGLRFPGIVLLSLICLVPPVAAQSIRDSISGSRLGSGYAQVLNVAATPDLTAAHYDVQSGSGLRIDVVRLPYESRWRALSSVADLYWRVVGSYLQMGHDFGAGSQVSGPGNIASTWSAYSATGGLLAKIRLGQGFTLMPAVDVGLARLNNRAGYEGAAVALRPALDGLLFNWHTNAWVVTPNLGLEWTVEEGGRKVTVTGHVGWSRITSFGESDPVQSFAESAGVYSMRIEHTAPSGLSAFHRRLEWVLYGGYSGFYGPNRNALGFTSVGEIGGGIEAPLRTDEEDSKRVRMAGSYLLGSHVTGWTISVGLIH